MTWCTWCRVLEECLAVCLLGHTLFPCDESLWTPHLKNKIYFSCISYFMCVQLSRYMCRYLQRPEGICSPELQVVLLWTSQCACLELNLGPLQEQQILLTAEPALWPLFIIYLFTYLLTVEDPAHCVEVRKQLSRNWFFVYTLLRQGLSPLFLLLCWVWKPYPIPVLCSLPSVSSTIQPALLYVF